MNKAILGLLIFGLPAASIAANDHRESLENQFSRSEVSAGNFFRSMSVAEERETFTSAANQGERAMAFDFSERRGFRDARESEPSRLTARHIATPSVAATPSAVAAPEIDPVTAAGGLTLLLGALAVLRGRQTRMP
jgi:hypothetical protein